MGGKKKIATDGFGSANENTYKYKRKPPEPYREPEIIRELIRKRERHFWLNKIRDRKDIEEFMRMKQAEWDKQDKREKL